MYIYIYIYTHTYIYIYIYIHVYIQTLPAAGSNPTGASGLLTGPRVHFLSVCNYRPMLLAADQRNAAFLSL